VEKAIALVSGGLKSAIMVAAERDRSDLLVLHIETGSRASAAERTAFDDLCEKLAIANPMVVSLPHVVDMVDHLWFDPGASASDLDVHADILDAYVPGLMPTMLSVAVLYAVRSGARRILVGACEYAAAMPRPGSVAPDHRKEFYQVYNEMLATAVPALTPAVVTPLIDLPLPDIIKLGQRLRAPLDATWSCLAGSDDPCGRCAGCRARAVSFLQAGIADPALTPARTA
jgi:7-cyano-7-deazaguanine synthase